ncbi:hypothetical protein [Prochlorococcus marinus]|uniref:hypothetical protein n=1 Tax=Prochlorococcus marinus TaxID=1219 RepID=UPI0012DA454B|nr:hypothetical protein [Prochlorococcus marinus]
MDSCRFDTFSSSYHDGALTNISKVGPLHKAKAPSYFTYGSHAAFWMGFTPGVINNSDPCLNPKAGKIFRMAFSGSPGRDDEGFHLQGANVIEGFRQRGYKTIGSGAVDWFNPATETGAVLGTPFDEFHFAGNTWRLRSQLEWIDLQISQLSSNQPVFCFLNIGETHVPYWHEGAAWDRWPSPCVPFGGDECDAVKSAFRQRACLEWVDSQLSSLLQRFSDSTVLICADHGDCWGEDGLWEHGISHPSTLTVPLILRLRGKPVFATEQVVATSPSRTRSVLSRLRRWSLIRS